MHPSLVFGALHIHWRLLHTCIRECGYCPIASSDFNCVFMRDRLLKMAARIIEQPRPFYAFTFTGGEPTLHPFLPDLSRFILMSGRNIGVTIETTGAADLDYYDALLAGLPKGVIRLSLTSQPAWHDAEKIGAIHEIVAKRGQLFHLRLMLDPGDSTIKPSVEFLSSLILRDPNITHEVRRLPDFKEFSFSLPPKKSPAVSYLAMEASFQLERKAIQQAPISHNWRIQGANLLLIMPDGYCHSSANPMEASAYPLWHESATVPTAHIVDCAHQATLGGIENIIPGFESRKEAEAFIEQYALQRKIWEFEAPLPRRKLAASKMQARDIVRARLKRYTAQAAIMPVHGIRHETLGALHLEDITEIFSRLRDKQSQETLLQAITAMQTGTVLADIQPSLEQETGLTTLRLDGVATLGELRDLAKRISWEWPELDLTIALNGAEFIESLLWLMEELPEHIFNLYALGGEAHLQAWLPETPWPAPISQTSDSTKPAVSVIIACRNVQDRIGRSLDSVLIQKTDSLEIIIVDDASDDATWDVIEFRRRDAKNLFKTVRLKESIGHNKATDLAFEQARGKYLLLLQPGDILSTGFLDCLRQEDALKRANVLLAGTALLKPETEKLIRLEAGGNTLGDFLFAWSRGYSISACLIEKDFARQIHLRPMAARGDMDIHLGVQIFAGAPSIARIDLASVAVEALAKLPDGENAIRHLVGSLEYLRRIAADYQITPTLLEECVQQLYWRYFNQALDQINEDESLRPEMASLTRYPSIVRNFLTEAAAQFCEQRHLKPVLPAEERDWASQAANPVPNFNMEAYGYADNPDPEIPKLTIIYYNRNGAKTLERSLDSILNQSIRNYEIFVMDDASEDSSWEILQDYADFNVPIRLYRSDHPAGRGWHSNFAYNRARGHWLLFMDSTDLLEAGILEIGLKTCQTVNPEICIYTLQHILPNNEISWRQFILDGRKTTEEAWHLYETGELAADSPCVFYKTGFTRTAGCSFGIFVSRPEDYFFAKALNSAKTIITWDKIGAQKIVKQDYNLPPAEISYKAISSALRLQAYLANLIGRTPYGQLNPASVLFKNMLLPALQAYLCTTGEMPLTHADYELVADNPSSILELMRDYASQNAWELSRPAPVASPVPAQEIDPLVCVVWKGEDQDLVRNLVNFSTQHLRQWILLAPERARSSLPEDSDDLRIVGFSGEVDIPASVKYVSFSDYGSYLEPGDLLRAGALLERDEEIDFVCFMEQSPFRIDPEPGEYVGLDLLALHLDEQTAPMHWQACVFRRSFLENNELSFSDSAAGGELLLINALVKAQKIRLLLPEESHARRLRLKPGPGAAQRLRDIAHELSHFFSCSPNVRDIGCRKLILKFMDECNLKPVLAHEIDELTSTNS